MLRGERSPHPTKEGASLIKRPSPVGKDSGGQRVEVS